MNILLVEPEFPLCRKSKNHSAFLPIGLLKIGSYHRKKGDKVKLICGNVEKKEIGLNPEKILITSLFTYWSSYVEVCVKYYKEMFPKARVEVGGIFASLMPDECKKITGCHRVSPGLYASGKAENIEIDYTLLPEPINYQIIHASRGCFRSCSFCGVWKIEPNIFYKKSIASEIRKNRLIFYDNNLLANPNIENIIDELTDYKYNNRVVYSESQSGLDGRILAKKPYLAKKLKAAHFKNPRIAWDSGISSYNKIENQIGILKEAGYVTGQRCNIYVFMLFNHRRSFEEMLEKLEFCRKWGVLVIDCRYRPLNQLYDNYKSYLKSQKRSEYYIAPKWNDMQVREFRRKVRRQNIAIRLNLPEFRYIDGVEKRYIDTRYK
jgi:hypothetical protein